MMIHVEKCCSQKGRLLVTPFILQHGKAFSPVLWRSQSLDLGIQLALCCPKSSSEAPVWACHCSVERSFIDLLLHTVYQRPSSEHNHLSQMALLVLNHSVSWKKMQTLLSSWLTTESFWPHGHWGSLSSSLIDVLGHWLQRLLQDFLVSVPVNNTLNWFSCLPHWNDGGGGGDLMWLSLLSKNPLPFFYMCMLFCSQPNLSPFLLCLLNSVSIIFPLLKCEHS